MSIDVVPVKGKTGRDRFIKLQWKFYVGDRNWVPPLLMDRRKILDPDKNPFFKHAEMQLFIAEKNGEGVGRIAAIVNHSHNKVHGDKIGFFGFFESVNDQNVTDALFNAAGAWLKSKGMDTMRGPVNPSINDDMGLLVDGFDMPPVILMTYNPRYYPLLFEESGLEKSKDLYAYLLHNEKVRTPKLERGQELVRKRYNLTIRDMDFGDFDRELPILKDMYNRTWEKNWGSVAMTDAEFDALATDMKQSIGKFKNMVFIAELDGVPVGFAFCMPDLNQVLIGNKKGRLLPAVYRMLTQTKRIDLVRIIALGVLKEYRGKGIDAVMYWEALTRAARHGILMGEASWVLEDNEMMNRGAKLMNGDLYKTYRMYDKVL